MGQRVIDEEVRKVLGDINYDTQMGIDTANVLVDDQLLGKGLSTVLLKQIELYLAAHFASIMYTDGTLATQEIGEARERYHNIYKQGLQSTRYGQQAILLDTTGTLAELSAATESPRLRAEFQVIGINPAYQDIETP